MQTRNCSAALKPSAIVGEKRNSLICNNAIIILSCRDDWQNWVPSVSGNYSAVDTFLDVPVDAVRQRIYQGCAFFGEIFFRRRTAFELFTPTFDRSYRNGVPRAIFGKCDSLTEKRQNFATKRFTRAITHVFPPSFTEIGRMRGIHDEKIEKVSSWSLSPALPSMASVRL